MTIHPIDPNKEATYKITLGSTFDQNQTQSLHALKYNFKPAAIDYSLPGHLTSSEDVPGEVELALPSTTEGEHHIFKGPLQEAKANEFVLIFNPETNSFVLEHLSSLSRLSATRTSRTNTLTNNSNLNPNSERPANSAHKRHKSNDDIPTISLEPPPSATMEDILDLSDAPSVPALVTPRLPPVSPMRSRHPRPEEIESSDDDDDDINIPQPRKQPEVDPDDDVSDEDLDDLANELESSLENRPGSSSSDADSEAP